jgi:hypothetical protein
MKNEREKGDVGGDGFYVYRKEDDPTRYYKYNFNRDAWLDSLEYDPY